MESPKEEKSSGVLARILSVFAEVRPSEVASVLLLTLNVFFLLLAYYFLKTVREPLILTGGGAEVKSYAAAGQAVLLIGVVQAYGALAKRFGRMALSAAVSLFFASNLVIFYALAMLKVPLGVPFYLWVGCFNVTVLAQFWAFANDVYTPEEGKRLFAIVGVGSSTGAVAGARIAKAIYAPVGPYTMMLIAAGVLLVCLALTLVVHRIESKRPRKGGAADAPPGGKNGFAQVVGDRYLLLIAALTLLLNWVNSTGEYILDRTLLDWAGQEIAAGRAEGKTAEQIIGIFKADYFGWVNIVGAVLQLFFVSRIFKYLGVRAALFVLPCVALFGYGALAFVPLIGIVKVAKIAENSTDYSIQNTARQALFLPVPREAKYGAKAAIDTFVMRSGDVLSAVVVYLGSKAHLATTSFALVNLVLVVVWLGVVVALGREHRRRTAAEEGEAAAVAAG